MLHTHYSIFYSNQHSRTGPPLRVRGRHIFTAAAAAVVLLLYSNACVVVEQYASSYLFLFSDERV